MRVFYDRDADVNLIKSKKVAIFGYGSQGHAHANNLRDSGVAEVVVSLRADSASIKKAESAGLRVMGADEAAGWADIAMVLTPDELQAALYRDHLEANLRDGAALAFAHGFNIHFRLIEPREDLDVFMIAPKGPGHTVRSEFVRGAGVPCLLAVARDVSELVSLSYLVILLGLIVLLRHALGTAATLLIITFAISGTMGIYGWLGTKPYPDSCRASL